jgi:soluble lytic murein transglycosylase
MWYILMNALTERPETAASLVKALISRWHSVPYFADALDRLSRYLTVQRQWKTLEEIFGILRSVGGGSVTAQYAWILGRAVQEGYLKTGKTAEDFFADALEERNASFYYRAMSASKLGIPFIPADGDSSPVPATVPAVVSPEMEFLLGFFEFGAAEAVLPYIRGLEDRLDIPELRVLADALAAADRPDESLNLISRYIGREDYRLSPEDLNRYYPRHFQELIEKNALAAEVGAEILFALIRTESFFMPGAVSRSGAVGLCQLMAPTALDMAGRIARAGGPDYRAGEMDLKNPEVNIHIGAYYLNYLTGQMGSPMMALLAYNGGMGRLRRWRAAENQLPEDLFLETIEFEETREYGRRVLAAAAVYGYLYYGMSMEAVAADIYK